MIENYFCSPNAEEALSLLSIKECPNRQNVESAARQFLDFGVGHGGRGAVVIRSGALGAYTVRREHGGRWTVAYWTSEDSEKVVDVTGEAHIS